MGGYNPKLQYPENPWKENRFPGASSSGSGTATAAGLAFGTLGSDTGGSIRFPAAACGVVGLKPTWGRVSRYGVMDLAASLDHVGPLARTAADAGIMLQAISGHDPNDPTTLLDPVQSMIPDQDVSLSGLRLGFDETYASEDLSKDYAAAVRAGMETFESLGATIVEARVPPRLRDYLPGWAVICSSEAAHAHRETFPARMDDYGPWFREWLSRGAAYSAADYAAANNLRAACVGEMRTTMQGIDALILPGAPAVAHEVSPDTMWGPVPKDRDPWNSRFTVPFDYDGSPTISLPCGMSDEGLPFSLQLAGHALTEHRLVMLGHAFEQATEWHTLHPPGW